uniref:Putative acyltransferase n=1 Tax=Desulfovibrio sp. U5L TaxID=596152 RepID=I2Q1Y5_9BACT
MTGPARPEGGRTGEIAQLHAIRSLAMAAIFCHHLWLGLPELGRAWQGTLLDAAFRSMSLGVVVFNVMTAFLMGLPFFGPAPVPPPAFGPYVRKRLRRLYPSYALAVLVLTAVSAAVFRLSDWQGLATGVASHLLFLDPFWTRPFYGNMAAYWWLGLLVQFTLVFPWLVRLVRGPGPGPAGWCLLSAAVMWPVTVWIKARGAAAPGTGWDTFAFLWTFNLPPRLPEFLCGLWMAQAYREQAGPGWPFGRGLALFLGGGCLAAFFSGIVPGAPSLGHMSGAVWSLAIFAVLFRLPCMAVAGAWAWVRRFSTLSYGVYLCHQPLLSFCGPATAGLAPWTRFALAATAAGAASLIGAWLLERATAAVLEARKPGKAVAAGGTRLQNRIR